MNNGLIPISPSTGSGFPRAVMAHTHRCVRPGTTTCVRVCVMPASKDRPISPLQRELEAVNASFRDRALGILPYIPARRRAAAPRPRDITLPAGFISPSLPMTAFAAPSGELWLHEIKLDGLRVIARNDGQRVRLYSKTGDDLSERYPLIVEAMARLPYCTIDGEAVACDEKGIASFDLLQSGRR